MQPYRTIPGPPGDNGCGGRAGLTGAAGPQGPQGASGGPQGPQGTAGVQGSQGATGAQGATGVGTQGPAGPQGVAGLGGPQGPAGLTGPQGAGGPAGPQGLAGAQGSPGTQGPQGNAGAQGAQGAAGASGLSEFASFFALMPGDNAATVAVGAAVQFPQNGPTSGTITRTGPSTFNVPTIGTYEVSWQVSVSEAGQLVAALNGTQVANTVAGRATGTSQIMNSVFITTTLVNSVLDIRNPAGNAAALTITPIAGGTNAVSAWLTIKRLA